MAATTKVPLFKGDPIERLVAILISIVTLAAAVAGYLEFEAGAKGDGIERAADHYARHAIGLQTRGEIEVGYALTDAYRKWLALDTQAFLAEQSGDTVRAEHYADMRDAISELSPLLAAPYFDPTSTTLPDIDAYEADTYIVETELLREQFANASSVADAWDTKANRHVTHITLLTVTLFLYGLSLTMSERISQWFMAIGTTIAVLTLIWLVFVVIEPIETLTDEGMTFYAAGMGLQFQNQHTAALAEFDNALMDNPTYANAYYGRARSNFALQAYAAAIADYEAALAHGHEGVNTPWNLGWAYYVNGDLDSAIAQTQSAIAISPTQIALHYNLGLMALAAGDMEQALAAYDHGAELATLQVFSARQAGAAPPATLWWYLSQASADLDNLLRCLEEQICAGAPRYEAVATNGLQADINALNLQLKSLTVSLEYEMPPIASDDVVVTDLTFTEAIYNDAGQIAEYRPLFTDTALRTAGTFDAQSELADVQIRRSVENVPAELFITFDYENIDAGQLLIAKVYEDGREVPGLRMVYDWALAANGEAVLPLNTGATFALNPGRYYVELYVNSSLLQTGAFIIAEE